MPAVVPPRERQRWVEQSKERGRATEGKSNVKAVDLAKEMRVKNIAERRLS